MCMGTGPTSIGAATGAAWDRVVLLSWPD
jgi:hypothetical protein